MERLARLFLSNINYDFRQDLKMQVTGSEILAVNYVVNSSMSSLLCAIVRKYFCVILHNLLSSEKRKTNIVES